MTSCPTIMLDARCIDHLPYGVGRYAAELTTRLPLLQPNYNWIIIRQGSGSESRAGSVTTLHLEIPADSYAEEQRWWVRLNADWKPDLVHSLWFHTAEAASCPKVLTVQDMIFLKGYATYRNASLIPRQQWHFRSINAADHIIVPSLNTLRDVSAMARVSPDRITPIRLACSDRFSPERVRDLPALRQALGLPESYFVVSAHQSTPYKNTHAVVAAAHILAQDGDTPPALLCSGTAPPSPAVRNLGFLAEDHLATVLAGARALIVPSLDEGFGLPVLEAMTSGVPVICSRHGSLPEVGGEAVLYFDPESPAELADAIRLITMADNVRATMIERGLERARHFSWTTTAQLTLALYDRILVDGVTGKAHAHVDWDSVARTATLPQPS